MWSDTHLRTPRSRTGALEGISCDCFPRDRTPGRFRGLRTTASRSRQEDPQPLDVVPEVISRVNGGSKCTEWTLEPTGGGGGTADDRAACEQPRRAAVQGGQEMGGRQSLWEHRIDEKVEGGERVPALLGI